jgi:3',5'-cyclic AMP phosphodiesterase CpdA
MLRDALPTALREVDPDVVIVTGDVTTDGSSGASKWAKYFLFREYDGRGSHRPDIRISLELSRSQVVVVPGNHDRYRHRLPFQHHGTEFERHLELEASYPSSTLFVHPDMPRPLQVIAVDSTRMAGPNGKRTLFRAPWDDPARGVVFPNETRRIAQLCDEQRNAFNIVALHHHPVVIGDGRVPFVERQMQLDHATDFRKGIRGKADVVAFGHKHRSMIALHEGTIYACSASTLVRHPHKPSGFVVYNFTEGTRGTSMVNAVSWAWNGADFVPGESVANYD